MNCAESRQEVPGAKGAPGEQPFDVVPASVNWLTPAGVLLVTVNSGEPSVVAADPVLVS